MEIERANMVRVYELDVLLEMGALAEIRCSPWNCLELEDSYIFEDPGVPADLGSPRFIEMFKRLEDDGTIRMDVPAYGVTERVYLTRGLTEMFLSEGTRGTGAMWVKAVAKHIERYGPFQFLREASGGRLGYVQVRE